MFSVCLVDVTRLTNSWSNNSSVMYTYLFVYIIYIPVRVYTNICYIYTYSHILFVFLFSLAWLARLMCSRTRYVSIWFAFFDKFAIIFLFFSLSHIGCMSTGRKNGFNVKNTHTTTELGSINIIGWIRMDTGCTAVDVGEKERLYVKTWRQHHASLFWSLDT